MPYKGEIGFARLTNLMMNVFIGLVLGLTFLFVANDVSTTSTQELAIGFLQAFVLSVCVGYAMGDIIPTLGIAQKVCDALGLQSGFMRHLVTSLILSLQHCERRRLRCGLPSRGAIVADCDRGWLLGHCLHVKAGDGHCVSSERIRSLHGERVVSIMACYPCDLCNKCGRYDWLKEAGKKCRKCGEPFEKGMTTCPSCGAPLPLPPGLPSSAR